MYVALYGYNPKSNLPCYHIFDPFYPSLPPTSFSLWPRPYCCLCLWVFACILCVCVCVCVCVLFICCFQFNDLQKFHFFYTFIFLHPSIFKHQTPDLLWLNSKSLSSHLLSIRATVKWDIFTVTPNHLGCLDKGPMMSTKHAQRAWHQFRNPEVVRQARISQNPWTECRRGGTDTFTIMKNMSTLIVFAFQLYLQVYVANKFIILVYHAFRRLKHKWLSSVII